jgi:hypothetical protein
VNAAAMPWNVTAVAPVKARPVIVTEVSTRPEAGLNGETVGITLNVELVAVPAAVVTAMGPVSAPFGTLAVIWLSEFTVKLALTPLKVTAVAPVKWLPLIVTEARTLPEVGEKEEMAGAADAVTVNEFVLVPVPPGPVTAMGPVAAPAGTVAVIWVAELTVKGAGVPPTVTAVAPVNPVPVSVTEAPALPVVG